MNLWEHLEHSRWASSTRALVYYGSVIAFSLAMTVRAVSARRSVMADNSLQGRPRARRFFLHRPRERRWRSRRCCSCW
ncbi:MAG: hypothetical protein R3A48_18460 [Polyangiales bacterium]